MFNIYQIDKINEKLEKNEISELRKNKYEERKKAHREDWQQNQNEKVGKFVKRMMDKPLVLPNIDRNAAFNNAKLDAANEETKCHP
tara:strand:+ start:105 stop:362 length:258 start_codon:yes stop_codon:yes gene_type:complete